MAYKFSETGKLGDEFQRVFGIGFKPFYDGLMSVASKQLCIDILKFDEWLHEKHGNYEDAGQSMDDCIREHYGDEGARLINEVIGADDDNPAPEPEPEPEEPKKKPKAKAKGKAKTKPVEQTAFNNRIALSLLRQCAWMWEHCMRGNNEGSFTMKDVRMGLRPQGRYKSPAGFIMFDLGSCEYWDVFDRQGIEGVSYDAKNERMSMFLPYDPQGDQTLGFGCSFEADAVFDVAYQMCSQSLLQKVRFCYKDGERWADIPDIDVKPAKNKATTKKTKPKAKATKAAGAAAEHQPSSIIHQPSFAEKLREALLRQFRQAA
jgi:hypothetical protein